MPATSGWRSTASQPRLGFVPIRKTGKLPDGRLREARALHEVTFPHTRNPMRVAARFTKVQKLASCLSYRVETAQHCSRFNKRRSIRLRRR